MANRNTLHISKLEEFKEWLEKDGWEIVPTSSNIYEILRARKPGRRHPLVVYSRNYMREHLGVADRDVGVIRAFIKENGNNGIYEGQSKGRYYQRLG